MCNCFTVSFYIIDTNRTMRLLALAWNVLSFCLNLYSVFVNARECPPYSDISEVDMTNVTEHAVSKREVHKDMVGFNKRQRLDMLRRHNLLRIKRRASNMMFMVWDTDLEKMAQDWAEQCIFKHSPDRKGKAGYTYIGENLYATTGEFDPADVVQAWYDEVQHYDYNTGTCSPDQVCGHYTQVVWASSRSLGCGVKYCKELQETTFGRGYNIVCHYGPGGNIVGTKPYAQGDPCSKCSTGIRYCINSLCSIRPQIASGCNWNHLSLSQNGVMLISLVHLIVIGAV